MQASYDLVIIGGGPGGCMAALHAAEKGISVCLLEKTRDIGYPVRCGEAIGFSGLNKFFKPEKSWVASTINSINLISPDITQNNADTNCPNIQTNSMVKEYPPY